MTKSGRGKKLLSLFRERIEERVECLAAHLHPARRQGADLSLKGEALTLHTHGNRSHPYHSPVAAPSPAGDDDFLVVRKRLRGRELPFAFQRAGEVQESGQYL